MNEKKILTKAQKGDISILFHPLVDIARDSQGYTPLHLLASKGCLDVLKHKSVDKVLDDDKRTPLHWLASCRLTQILSHKSVDKIADFRGWTPIHYLAYYNVLTEKELELKYKYFNFKNKEITPELITEALNTPNIQKFLK